MARNRYGYFGKENVRQPLIEDRRWNETLELRHFFRAYMTAKVITDMDGY